MDDRKLFKDVELAMKSVGFAENEVKSIWQLMSAILNLGNVTFVADGESALVNNKGLVKSNKSDSLVWSLFNHS